MAVNSLKVHSDSQLMVRQLQGDYEAKDPRMSSYLKMAIKRIVCFEHFEITQVPRSQNSHAYSLARLASALSDSLIITISVEFLLKLSTAYIKLNPVQQEPSWMDEIMA